MIFRMSGLRCSPIRVMKKLLETMSLVISRLNLLS